MHICLYFIYHAYLARVQLQGPISPGPISGNRQIFISEHMCKYLLVSVCIRSISVHIFAYFSLSDSILWYLCISVYMRYISANTSICVYQSYIRAYIHISVHICAYMFICSGTNLQVQSLGPISPEPISGSNLRVQSQMFISVHMCWYLIISVCIRSISVHIFAYLLLSDYICAYLCISVYMRYISANICVYQSYIRAYIHVSVHICAYMFISKNFISRGKNQFFRKKDFWF